MCSNAWRSRSCHRPNRVKFRENRRARLLAPGRPGAHRAFGASLTNQAEVVIDLLLVVKVMVENEGLKSITSEVDHCSEAP